MKRLAMEVGELDDVGVDHAEVPYARGGEVHRSGRTERAEADDDHRSALQPLLSLAGPLRQDELARVALELEVGERTHADFTIVTTVPSTETLCPSSPAMRGTDSRG